MFSMDLAYIYYLTDALRATIFGWQTVQLWTWCAPKKCNPMEWHWGCKVVTNFWFGQRIFSPTTFGPLLRCPILLKDHIYFEVVPMAITSPPRSQDLHVVNHCELVTNWQPDEGVALPSKATKARYTTDVDGLWSWESSKTCQPSSSALQSLSGSCQHPKVCGSKFVDHIWMVLSLILWHLKGSNF